MRALAAALRLPDGPPRLVWLQAKISAMETELRLLRTEAHRLVILEALGDPDVVVHGTSVYKRKRCKDCHRSFPPAFPGSKVCEDCRRMTRSRVVVYPA